MQHRNASNEQSDKVDLIIANFHYNNILLWDEPPSFIYNPDTAKDSDVNNEFHFCFIAIRIIKCNYKMNCKPA